MLVKILFYLRFNLGCIVYISFLLALMKDQLVGLLLLSGPLFGLPDVVDDVDTSIVAAGAPLFLVGLITLRQTTGSFIRLVA